MALTIANNVSSLTAQHNLTRSSRGLNRSLERLASGFKVNRGADGPAALVISEKQRAQIAGLNQSIDNAEKAIVLVQTAEGALNEINALLIKVRALAIDSANTGVNDDDALRANQDEIDNALETIERIANNTQFGTKKLLDGTAGIFGTPDTADITFIRGSSQTSAGTYAVNITSSGKRATTDAGTAQTSALAASELLTINGVQIALNAGSTQSDVVNRINEFESQTGVRADAGGAGGATRLYTVQFGLEAELRVSSDTAAAADSTGFGTSPIITQGANIAGTIDGASFVGNGNFATSNSGPSKGVVVSIVEDPSDPTQTAAGALGNVIVQDNSLVFHIGPNQYQMAKIAVGSVLPTALALNVVGNQFTNLSEISVLNADSTQDTIAIVDAAIDDVTRLRGFIGAFQQNTLESTASNLRATLENTVAAESVIRDTDFAAEISNFTKHQVLTQAGTSVLASANQGPQLVLSLLGG